MITGNLNEILSPLRTIVASVDIKHNGTEWDSLASNDRVQSIEIDRVGENKFFGFGICQKAIVKVIDKEKAFIGLNNDYSLEIAFNGANSLPLFYVENASREENKDIVTITAFDAIKQASAHTVRELERTTYTIGELAAACAQCLGLTVALPALDAFSLHYEDGGNFDGTETIREALNAIAEVTQTIYFVNYENKLVFTQLDISGAALFNIDKSQYYTLENKEAVTLNEIAVVTELGNNLSEAKDIEGVAQNIYNNPLLELREDTAEILTNAVESYCGISINQFSCTWRGNYFLEPCDKITVTTKDDSSITTFLLNDTITYNGGYKQVSKWEYTQADKPFTNPTTIGESLKQTFAKVDKVNKQIDIVASESNANKAAISAIQLNTDSISGSISTIQEQVDSVNGSIEEINKKVSATMTEEQVAIAIESRLTEGVTSVETTTGFTFNENGLTVSKSNSEISTTITEDGMQVHKRNTEVLTANNEGVKAVDLHATTFLLIGKNSRFEDYNNNRTGCFWIGG